MRCHALRALLCVVSATPAAAQSTAATHVSHVTPEEERSALVAEPAGGPLRIDGALDEDAWRAADPGNGFIQQSPRPGAAAQFDTDVRVVFDGTAIYVGVRAYDPAPDSIVARLARRDAEIESDWVHVAFDSYGDRRSAYQFGVNAAGVKRDVRITDDTREDVSWDAVWDVATQVNADGWTAEFRIPFAQLRRRSGVEGEWRFNARRVVSRTTEVSYWAPIPNNAGTYVSSFGTLRGVRPPAAVRTTEITPYVSSRVQHDALRAANPYYRRTELGVNAGVDMKLNVAAALTLRATINPDFGQVEADPSTVNLTAYEQFLPERRPFFVEGAEHFNAHGPRLFYSRRIGRAPQGRVSGADAVAMPEQATLLGAVKLTGQTGPWSVGFLDAVTAAEHARYRDSTGEHRALVEPATNYTVASVTRDFRDGATGAGAILTAMQRFTGPGQLPHLRTSAYAGGVDARHRFAGNRYELRGSLLASHVSGDTAAIAATQRAAGHYFQRPDADHLVYDPARRSLTGAAARAGLVKVAGGNWRASVEGSLTTPAFEINDVGFYNGADRMGAATSLRYLQHQPGRMLRRWSLSFWQRAELTTGGERLDMNATADFTATLHNQWTFSLWAMRHEGGVDPVALRGGPALHEPGRWMGSIDVQTDPRRPVSGSLGVFGDDMDDDMAARTNIYAMLRIRPSPRLEATLQPSLGRWRTDAQYVSRRTLDGEPVYLLGTLRQQTAAVSIRLNYTFTPSASLQFYAQPYISAGTYSAFRRVRDAHAADRRARFVEYDSGSLDRTVENAALYYGIDEDGDGSAELQWRDPSFNFRQIRSSAVFRWEFRPASTLFVVWTQERTDSERTGDFSPGRDARRLVKAAGPQALMVKLTYWLGM